MNRINFYILICLLSISNLYAQETEEKMSQEFEYYKHKAGIDLVSPFGKEILFHYEYLLPKKSVSIRVPLGFSYNERGYPFKFFQSSRHDPLDIDYQNQVYPYVSSIHAEKTAIHTGMDFIVYFNKARRVRPYVAQGVFIGMFIWEKRSEIVDYDGINHHYTILGNESTSSVVLGGEFKIGMQIMAHKRISIAIEGGAGIGKHLSKNISDSMLAIRRGSLILAYHFGNK